ncbi:MAG: phage tail family protein [Treponema sp.]|nr:phage tail family protein [Treponema sp.]
MQKLSFTNSKGITIDLTKEPLGITQWEGLSNVGMEIQSQPVPFVDGSVFIDTLLENREIALILAMQDNKSLLTRYMLRRQLISVLNPKLGEGILTYTNNYTQKQIRCIPDVPTFQNHNSNDSGTPKANLLFTACDPYWEDIEPTVFNLSLTEQPVITNEGDAPAQVKLNISGQCTNVRVTNVTTESQIGLTGTITEPVEINTQFGKKTVTGYSMGWTNIFGGYLYGVADKSGITVIAGTDGAVLVSRNGIDWKSCVSGTLANLYGLASCFNLDRFVAVGSGGTIITSVDGSSWENGSNSSTSDLFSIACSDTKFVAVGAGGTILTSTDGENFTSVTSPVSTDLFAVCYDGAFFVAVGRNGTVITSQNGTSWEPKTSGVTESLYGITFAEEQGVYIAVGSDGRVIRSSNADSWESVDVPATDKLNSVSYNTYTGSFIIAGDNGTVIEGVDEWAARDAGTTKNLTCARFVKDVGLTFCCGQGLLLRSPNGNDWVKCISMTESQLHDILYVDSIGMYIAPGNNGDIAISRNGGVWENRSIRINVDIYSIAYNPDSSAIIGVGTGGTIVRSFDAQNWEKVLDGIEPYEYYLKVDDDSYLLIDEEEGSRIIIATSEGAGALYGVLYNAGLNLFVAVGDGGRICTSADGSIWDEQSSGVNDTLYAIAISGRTMVAAGDNGVIISSVDAVHWQRRESGTFSALRGLTTSPTKSKFLAVGDDGAVAISGDGEKWRLSGSSIHTQLNSVCYSSVYSQFLAVGNNGTIVSSNDGQSWKGHSSGTGQNYEGVKFFPALNKYVASGSKGTIMGSYMSASENLINILNPNSDINFNLAVGENILRVACESGTPYVTVQFRNRYIGV